MTSWLRSSALSSTCLASVTAPRPGRLLLLLNPVADDAGGLLEPGQLVGGSTVGDRHAGQRRPVVPVADALVVEVEAGQDGPGEAGRLGEGDVVRQRDSLALRQERVALPRLPFEYVRQQGLDPAPVEVPFQAHLRRQWRLPGHVGRREQGAVDGGERHVIGHAVGARRGEVRVAQQVLGRQLDLGVALQQHLQLSRGDIEAGQQPQHGPPPGRNLLPHPRLKGADVRAGPGPGRRAGRRARPPGAPRVRVVACLGQHRPRCRVRLLDADHLQHARQPGDGAAQLPQPLDLIPQPAQAGVRDANPELPHALGGGLQGVQAFHGGVVRQVLGDVGELGAPSLRRPRQRPADLGALVDQV